MPRLDGAVQRNGRHDRLAGTDVALNQAVHAVAAPHIRQYLVDDLLLSVGQLERQRRRKAADRLAFDSERDAEAVGRAFERFGVIVIDEDASMGAGVRLKFTRQDVKQISRLEGEGGIVRSDDAP